MSQKKIRVGLKKVGSVGFPEMRHFFFLALTQLMFLYGEIGKVITTEILTFIRSHLMTSAVY